MRRRQRAGLVAVTMGTLCAACAFPSLAAGAPAYPDAVVMVSGYNSSTAFTTPDPSCAGQEGGTWANPAGPAAALRSAGLQVFTAPVQRGTDAVPAPCAPGGAPVPPAAAEIDSFGDNDANGAALAGFLAFLGEQYGVDRVQLVAHSDGGNWSRSAITQSASFANVEVRSVTTLGTPYTGSMIADLGTELRNGKCDFSDSVEQELCEALIDVIAVIYDGVGPTAVAELTRTYLQTWNQQQRIGSCPVTTIAGTGLSLPLLPFAYYNPSDGLVGEASALAHSAFALPNFETIPAPDIPGLRAGGTYPVVHAPSLSFIKAANLLNTPAVSSDVAEIVSGTPAGPSCSPAAVPAPVRGVTAAARFVLPLRFHAVPSPGGALGRAFRGDAVVAGAGVVVRCGRAEQPLLPLLGDRRLWIGFPDECDRQLRVSGRSATRRAMLVGADRGRDVVAEVRGDRLRIRVRGGEVRGLRARIGAPGSLARLGLNEDGWADLPEGDGSATLSVRVRLAGGRRLGATAVLAL